MRKVIKIFLGSSITEFKAERETIENFIRNISDNFEENYNIKLQPLRCENFDDAYTEIRKQEEYNNKVRCSDFCYFLFFTKAGKYTREEFEVARKKFEETGKPKIYTYFKVLEDKKADDSLYGFMDELDKVFGHYYGMFEHIDTVKLRILLNLKLQEMDFLEIKVDRDKCTVDGRNSEISLESVSEFANNKDFRELKSKFKKIDVRYNELKDKFESEECTDSEWREYFNVAAERQQLIDSIDSLRDEIFKMSLRMCYDEAHGEITERQRKAYRLFEEGKLEEANAELSFEEIKDDYKLRKALREAEQKKEARIFIRECKTKIEILIMMIKFPERFKEIEKIYDEIAQEAFEEKIELSEIIDYTAFLLEQNKPEKAIVIAKKLYEMLSSGYGNDDCRCKCLYNLSQCYAMKNETEKSLQTAVTALQLYKRVLENEMYDEFLAGMYTHIGNCCYNHTHYHNEAEKYYKKSLEIYTFLSEKQAEKYNKCISYTMMNLAAFYKNNNKSEEAEKLYINAENILKKLYFENPEEVASDLGAFYINFGALYSYKKDYITSAEYFEKAIYYFESVYKLNPERIKPTLGLAYMNTANNYAKAGVSNSDKTKKYFEKAVDILKEVAERNPQMYASNFLNTLYSAGDFFDKTGDIVKAEKYFISVIDTLEDFEKNSHGEYIKQLVDSYNRICAFYYKHGFKEKGIKAHTYLIELLEAVVNTFPATFIPDLALEYFNFANITKDDSFYAKARQAAELIPEHPICKQIVSVLTG